jgi:hypothetical protein
MVVASCSVIAEDMTECRHAAGQIAEDENPGRARVTNRETRSLDEHHTRIVLQLLSFGSPSAALHFPDARGFGDRAYTCRGADAQWNLHL